MECTEVGTNNITSKAQCKMRNLIFEAQCSFRNELFDLDEAQRNSTIAERHFRTKLKRNLAS